MTSNVQTSAKVAVFLVIASLLSVFAQDCPMENRINSNDNPDDFNFVDGKTD